MRNIGEIVVVEEMGRSTPSLSFDSYNSSSATKAKPELSLNHISFVCKSVRESVRFYQDVLGFVLIKRPSSFNFEGAWLFNYGIGIHLLEVDNVPGKKGKINPKDNHISFQTSDMETIKRKLGAMNIEYVTAVVEEGGITVDQLFFHDPDSYMIEICNCQNLPVLPLSSCPLKVPKPSGTTNPSFYETRKLEVPSCSGEVAALMMENLVVDMMNISL